MLKWKSHLVAPACAAVTIAFAATTTIDPNAYLNDVKFLSSDEMRGRASGSPELEKAASFIAGKFKEFGIRPADGKNYLQPFPVTTAAVPGKSNRFAYTVNGAATKLQFPADFSPFQFSPHAKMGGAVVFAGYGITAPEFHYDDYSGIDVKGKIVLILRHEPQENDEHSVFAGKELTDHAKFVRKASNAKAHGATGVILISDVANHPDKPDEIEKFGTAEGPSDVGIPFVQVKTARITAWFGAAGRSLETIEAGIDKDLQPESFAFPDSVRVDAEADVERIVKTVHNVAAFLPGETDEYVIVGAHYDHLGMGGQFSLAPNVTAVHHGADDNASGTAGVIELARLYAHQPKRKRGILFLTFAGEELGLLGSAYYVGHPELPLEKAVAMINMDMIGRTKAGKVYIGGVATGSTLRPLVDGVVKNTTLTIDYSDSTGYGSSDHTSFTIGRVPVLFFFSGLHSDYHKPSDTWDKIDVSGAVQVLQLVEGVVDGLRSSADRPQFVRVAPPAGHGEGAGPITSSSGGGYGPWFGSIPDFGEGVKGVKFADVREGSPAAKAGFKAGDVMTEFDGKPIQNLYDFTYALQAKKPGDEVNVKVLRDGKPVEAPVLLTKRP